jgi:hypothetical protein
MPAEQDQSPTAWSIQGERSKAFRRKREGQTCAINRWLSEMFYGRCLCRRADQDRMNTEQDTNSSRTAEIVSRFEYRHLIFITDSFHIGFMTSIWLYRCCRQGAGNSRRMHRRRERDEGPDARGT